MDKIDREKEIIEGFLAGEPSAYNTVNSWISTVLDYRSWHTSIRTARQDINQEVLTVLTENFRLNRYKGLGLKSYVNSVVKFTCLKFYDRNVGSRRKEQDIVSQNDSILEEIIRDEEYQVVKRALLRLSKNCQEILALRYGNQLGHNKIAGIFAISIETSRQRLKRCMENLRELMKEIYSL